MIDQMHFFLRLAIVYVCMITKNVSALFRVCANDTRLLSYLVPVFLEEPFVIRFLTNSSIAKSGFYAEYKVKVPQPLITTTEGNQFLDVILCL